MNRQKLIKTAKQVKQVYGRDKLKTMYFRQFK